ncbi:MAG: hypothetical protein IJI22_02135 [Bacilli bacterium]|nr:hypothetical protein [Bacilli bacterium]
MIYVGMILIAVVGTFLHFLYEISDHNKFVAIFAAVNESTWEHIKICMTPTILWSLYDGYIYGLNPNYILGKSLSLFTIIILIPILFYTYTAFTKKSILWVDVICFYITVICSGLVFNYFINANALPFIYTYLSSILLFIEVGAYMSLTFNPIKNFIFEDPISHKYGLAGHTELHDHTHSHNHNHKD